MSCVLFVVCCLLVVVQCRVLFGAYLSFVVVSIVVHCIEPLFALLVAFCLVLCVGSRLLVFVFVVCCLIDVECCLLLRVVC